MLLKDYSCIRQSREETKQLVEGQKSESSGCEKRESGGGGGEGHKWTKRPRDQERKTKQMSGRENEKEEK